MKKITISLLLVIMSFSLINAQDFNMGVGLKFGDPSGVTFKKYMSASNALEIVFGRTHYFVNNKFYNNNFIDWYGKQNFVYTDFNYNGFSSGTPVGLQVHYLFQKDISSLDGLQWYYGFGGQIRTRTYHYNFQYKIAGDNTWYYATDKITDLDIGADLVVGLEFLIPDSPITLFTDVTLFVELIDNPFAFWYQGGLGIRYNF